MASITEYIKQLLRGENLSFEQAREVLDIIFAGEVGQVQIAAFLTATRSREVTGAELAGFAKSLREHSVTVAVDSDNLVDTCGTGGAKLKTFNISTACALVAAGAGAYVAKHGNRGITSRCGSADVLGQLGVNIECGPEVVAECIREAHIGFMFAPCFHPAMRYVQPIRKELGFRTVFNCLGPLANPAGATGQVLGVGEVSLMEPMAEALRLLGVRRAMVVHSDGLDEISTMGVTKMLELKDGQVKAGKIEAGDYGIARADFEDLQGSDVETNARIVREILSGEETGPKRDIVVLNAAAAIVVSGLAADFELAKDKAEASISEGKALGCLERLVEVSTGGA